MPKQKYHGTCIANGKLYHGTSFKVSGWDVWVDGKKMTDDDGEIIHPESYARYLELRALTPEQRAEREAARNANKGSLSVQDYNAIEEGDIDENYEGIPVDIIARYGRENYIEHEPDIDEPEGDAEKEEPALGGYSHKISQISKGLF